MSYTPVRILRLLM